MNKARVERVDAALRRQKSARIIIATQDIDEPDIYHAADDVTYTLAELDRLSEAGTQVVRIDYRETTKQPGARTITLDESFGTLKT